MRRLITTLLLTLGGTLLVTAAAQSPANFVGTWTVDAAATAAANPPMPSDRQMAFPDLTISRDTTTITFSRNLGGTPLYQVYRLDGTPASNPYGVQNGNVVGQVDGAIKWDGAKLVVTNQMPNGTQTHVYAVDGARLVLTTTAPGREGGAPTTRVIHYTKVK